MTVFRSAVIQPVSIKAHVVMKAPGGGIEGIMKKSQISRGKRPHRLWLLTALPQYGENESPRVIVRAITFGKIGRTENGVLEHSGRIRHSREMIEVQLRQLVRLLIERLDQIPAGQCSSFHSGGSEGAHVLRRHIAPDHAAADLIRPLPHTLSPL